MRKRIHAGDPQEGAVAIIVAIVIIVLFGFTALAADVARMYGERRELQRTADASALAGARELVFSPANAMAEGEKYIDENATIYHPSKPSGPGFSPSTGDSVTVGTCPVPGLGISLPCVTSKVVAPKRGTEPAGYEQYGFGFLFATVLGIDDRAISATSTAVVGRGAPGGDQLVPWMVMDCPNATWDGPGAAGNTYDAVTPAQMAAEIVAKGINPNCTPDYAFSESWTGEKVDLFLADSKAGNFQGADFTNVTQTCPLPSGYWKESGNGKAGYEDILGRTKMACNIDRGARVWTEPGGSVGPTNHAIETRQVVASNCMTSTAFANTIEDPVPGDGFVSIKPGGLTNPCLVALALVVHPEDAASGLKTENVPGNVPAMQERVYLESLKGNKWDGRFAPLGSAGAGGKELMLVRRFAFFYLTQLGDTKKPYTGLFLKAFDSYNASLAGGACDPTIDAICKVKLIPTD
jgi:hypothetical protein